MIHKRENWKWFGVVGHFICGRWCRFHLTTQVGPWLVSTIGEYVHPRHSGGSEGAEAAWLNANWPGEDIGYGRKYETRVFRAGEPCRAPDCGCGQPDIGRNEVDFEGYNTRKESNEGHEAMCRKWADRIPE